MTLVELYSKPDCHLCDVAKEVMMRIQKNHPFTLNVISIREGDDVYETFKSRIPVIYINKEFAFQYKVPEQAFIEKLAAAAEMKR